MRRFPFLAAMVAAGGALAAPPVLPAQDDSSLQERDEVRIDRGPEGLMRIVMNRRARLGIKVNLRARDTDSIGAYVDAVTPGGPAAQAGIRSGDIITKLDGKSVLSGGPAPDGRRPVQESLPGLRLIELAARLAPNDTVPVEFRRGGERRTVNVVTAYEPDFSFSGPPGRRVVPFPPGGGLEPAADFLERFDGPAHWDLFVGSPLSRLELAPLNPDLGQYFGTSDGILVISAPKDSALGLKGGDVVLSVDGRRPAGPSHLLRILRSYETGESFKLDILRHRKRETLTARLGEPDS